jgi:pyrroline-5-carboxylate reductase
MGEALLSGLVRAGWDTSELRGADARPARREEMSSTYGVAVTETVEAAQGADTVILVVKPQDIASALSDIVPVITPDTLIISLAAGVTTATIEGHLGEGQPVVRVMPNTAALIGEGMAAICAGTSATQDHLARAEKILAAVGKVQIVAEKHMDAVTAVSGSGPAYVMLVAESMIDAGVLLGLPRPTATELVKQTLYGSSKLLVDSGEHPTILRENVTSPGGTTAAALRAFEDHGLRAAFIDAVEAACRRSEELGQA